MNQETTMNPAPKSVSLETLMQHSIEIVPLGVATVWPQFGSEDIIYPQETVSKFNGRFYAVNNSTIAFVSDDSRLFVVPFTRSVHRALLSHNYIERYFYVPFSNGDYPKYATERWTALRQAALREHRADKIRACCSWSDQHNIGVLPNGLLARTLEVPEDGIPYHSPRGYDEIYYGEDQGSIDAMKLGRFCRNNGVVAFVYRDGSTCIARGYRHIIPALTAAGYTETAFFVPFSNGETITDVALAGKWESLKR